MAIAEHHPEQLHAKNRGLLGMMKQSLHDYASTPETGLPKKKRSLKGFLKKKG